MPSFDSHSCGGTGLWLEEYCVRRSPQLQIRPVAGVPINRNGESSQPKQRKRKRKPSPQSPHSPIGRRQWKRLMPEMPNAPALSPPPSAAHHPLLPVRFFVLEMISPDAAARIIRAHPPVCRSLLGNLQLCMTRTCFGLAIPRRLKLGQLKKLHSCITTGLLGYVLPKVTQV